MGLRTPLLLLSIFGATASAVQNDRYTLSIAPGGAVTLKTSGLPDQTIQPEFIVLRSETDPQIHRNFNHPNYPIAPRPAVRWLATNEPADALNAWLNTPAMKAAVQWDAKVVGEGTGRTWEYRDKSGKVALRVGGRARDGATRPFAVGQKTLLRADRATETERTITWHFAPSEHFTIEANLTLPPGEADLQITYTLTPKDAAYYCVAFTGAPSVARRELLPIPQECAGRQSQGDFVLSEADLKLPRVMTVTRAGSLALVADPSECRFRLPTLADSRFGLMLAFEDDDRVKPVLLAPLLGGVESKMKANHPWTFTLRIAARAGDWKEMHRHIARDIHGLSDQRDNSGPGSLNNCLDRVMDFLADRNGKNFALWSDEQKYYDYFTDQTGVFKPFSPMYGLGAAIVTDDEAFYRRRALPAVEFALSRKYNLFAPYEGINRAMVKSAASEVGGPYPGYAQLMGLDELFQKRIPAIRALADEKTATTAADRIAQSRLTGKTDALDTLLTTSPSSEQALFDFLELYDLTHDPRALQRATEAAYRKTTDLNLYPRPPQEMITVDKGNLAPVHPHSIGRHKNIWGFAEPKPVWAPEQTVPAWRVSRLGLASPAYPIEYWMNVHAALLRVGALAHDDFLADVARNGMIGRFGNYPGDNRSIVSLISERADAVEVPPWNWNFATVNPGHAWDFAGAVIDFLVTDVFARSVGQIDFPASSSAGSGFRVRIYGASPGTFYGQRARLWLPRGLLKCDNRQINWITAYSADKLFLALVNTSDREETIKIALNRVLAQCTDGEARVWRSNVASDPVRITDNGFSAGIPPKGIVAVAIPAKVTTRLQAKLYAGSPRLGPGSFAHLDAPFGKLHAMILSAGAGLTTAHIYTEARPEDVIAARLRWRQGGGEWQEKTDSIYPYEFSPELREEAGDLQFIFEIENRRQQLQQSPLVTLRLTENVPAKTELPPAATSTFILPAPPQIAADVPAIQLDPAFLKYLQQAANPQSLGLHEGRFYPYSTPRGRRIAWGLSVWDKALYETGCTPEQAEQRLKLELADAHSQLRQDLASAKQSIDFDKLEVRQRETLLDFALSEGAAKIRPELLTAVLNKDWKRIAAEHLYVRHAGPAPDHDRNKAFAQRWGI